MANVPLGDLIQRVFDQDNNVIRTSAVVSSDIQIGAVELKDHDSTNRAEITASGELSVLDSNSAAIKTAVEIMDDWDESDRAKVNPIVGQAGITGGAGVVAANTPRTTLASDDPAVAALQIMDDWDETDRAKVNLIAAQAGITGGAGAVAANTPRVTLASDDPGVASLSVLDDWDESDRAKVNLIVGQAGIAAGTGVDGATVPRVTLATNVGLPAGTNNIGDVDVLSLVPGTGATSLGKAEDDPHASGDVGVAILAVRDDTLNVRSGAENDYEPLHTTGDGSLWVTPTPSPLSGVSVYRSLDLDETEEEVKATAGTVYGWYIANLATTTRFVKFYNATAANVSVGVNTPIMTFPIPGNATDDVGANALGAMGIVFDTAITIAATTGVADSDVGAPGANDVVINLLYK